VYGNSNFAAIGAARFKKEIMILISNSCDKLCPSKGNTGQGRIVEFYGHFRSLQRQHDETPHF
jgi:hypothetical protein